jgi:hypothetical protein
MGLDISLLSLLFLQLFGCRRLRAGYLTGYSSPQNDKDKQNRCPGIRSGMNDRLFIKFLKNIPWLYVMS